MYSNMTGELARGRQADLLASAQRKQLVHDARATRTHRLGQPIRIRHGAAAILLAVADRLEPVRQGLDRRAAGLVPDPCAAEPC